MFYFPSKHQLPSFPFWFHNWWTYFGPTIKILPKPILDGFELFKSSFVTPRKLLVFPLLLFFFSEFGLAWIVQWDYINITDECDAESNDSTTNYLQDNGDDYEGVLPPIRKSK